MPRNDGVVYGAGGAVRTIQEIVEPQPEEKPKKKVKKAQMLEERLHDDLPSDVEPGDAE